MHKPVQNDRKIYSMTSLPSFLVGYTLPSSSENMQCTKSAFTGVFCRTDDVYMRNEKLKPRHMTGLNNLLHAAIPALTKEDTMLNRTFKLGCITVITPAAFDIRVFQNVIGHA